jgi:hypothetical protein
MSLRTSAWIAGLTLVIGLAVVSTRPAGQAGGGTGGNAPWLRAVDAWESGHYPVALETLRELMRSPAAGEYFERAALLTGELFVTTEVTTDGRSPGISADGQYVSYEFGAGDDARTRIVQVTSAGVRQVSELPGTGVVFAPAGSRVAWVRPREAPGQGAAGSASTGDLVIHDLATGADETVPTGSLLVTGPEWAADGNSLFFLGADPSDLTRSDVYTVAPPSAPRRVSAEPGFKTGLQVGSNGRTLLYQLTTVPTFRDPAAAGGRGRGGGAGRGGRGGRGGPPPSHTVVDLATGAARTVTGASLAMSADGSTLAWLERDGTASTLVRSPALAPAPTEIWTGTSRIDAPVLSPDGSHVAFPLMPEVDWEIYVAGADGQPRRFTREIQHDVQPQFLTDTTLLAQMGEARHRRSHVYDLATGARTRVFDNNLVRTISPEYVWAASRGGRHLAIQADRDGDTVSVERGVSHVDLTRRVTMADLVARIERQLAAETDLRQRMTAAYKPVEDLARRVVGKAAVSRVYGYEKALFDFDSKHVTQPGNAKAIEYLERTYRSFGYAPEVQWFDARGNRSANVLARLRGTEDPDLIYVVSSHFDSVAAGPGADDDTSGTAALLEAARILADTPLAATVVFASFTGEEAGLLGSREFVRQAAEAGWRVVGALNNDMIGWGSESARMDNTIRYSNPGIKDLQHGAAFLFTDLITYDAKYYRSTDAAAFYEAWGDIVGGIGSYPVLANPNYHQPTDFLETINHRQVMETAKVTAATLVYLASSPSRLTDLAVRAIDTGVNVSWTPSPESNVREYIVAYGPAEDPLRTRVTVSQPATSLPRLPAGTHVAVKAVNARGLASWDWARVVLH